MINLLLSIYFWVVVALTASFYTSLIFANRCIGVLKGKKDTSNPAHAYASSWGRSVVWWIPGWKVNIEGRENLPKPGTAYVIVANHESATDILAMYYLNIQFRWLAKAEAFRLPVLGQAMKWAGYVPITRGDPTSHKKALDRSAEWLKSGTSMFFFPEGTRSKDGELREFKSGAFKLAAECDVPILPICISGTTRLLKKGSGSPGIATVSIKILPTIAMNDTESIEAQASQIRTLISENCISVTPDVTFFSNCADTRANLL